jgi:glycerol uptake facilitator-like aquaporin
MFGKNKVAALVAEFIGAGALTLLILSVQRSTIGVPFFVAAAAGLTVAVMAFSFYRVSGAHFNPAITIGMWTARRIPTLTALMYVVVQVLGAWAAYGLYTYFVNNTLAPIGGHATYRILVAEIVGTGIFTFAYAGAVYQKFSATAVGAAAGIGLMLGAIAASTAALGLLNPAVAVGVRAVNWAYIAGPIVGGLIGVNLYALLFAETEPKVKAATTNVATTAAKPKAAAKKPAAKKAPAKKK